MFVRQPPRGRWIIPGFTIVAAWGLAVSGDQLRAADLEEMASRVDARIAEGWEQEHVQPEPLAGDANARHCCALREIEMVRVEQRCTFSGRNVSELLIRIHGRVG